MSKKRNIYIVEETLYYYREFNTIDSFRYIKEE